MRRGEKRKEVERGREGEGGREGGRIYLMGCTLGRCIDRTSLHWGALGSAWRWWGVKIQTSLVLTTV